MTAKDKYFIKDEDSQYSEGVLLDEYHGKYSLVSARQGNDGTVYMQWAYPQKRDGSKTPIDKAVPWKVTFGNKGQAVNALRHFLGLLEGSAKTGDNEYPVGSGDRGPTGTNPGDRTADNDEIPF